MSGEFNRVERPGEYVRPRRGFALIIVVSLLALLILVLVSLATLTRIEAGVGANSLKHAQAKQYARFALDLAIAELQRHAGPDARITASASSMGVSGASRHWTGVWAPNGAEQTWLVSGNENGNLTYWPSTVAIGGLSGNSTALSRNVTVDARPARLLVGPKTVNSADISNFVVAPLVQVAGPVAGESTERTVGRYSWWVGDDGVKAQVTLRDPYAAASLDSSESKARLGSAQRNGIERVQMNAATQLGDRYPRNDDRLARVLSINQLPFLGGSPAEASDLRTAVRNRFHDLTANSIGVLADTGGGGLKQDLTRILGDGVGPDDATPIFTGGPTWARLRAYYNLRPTIGSYDDLSEPGAAAEMAPRVGDPSGGSMSLRPLVTGVSLRFALFQAGAETRVAIEPIVVMCNPYDVRLSPFFYRIQVENRGPNAEAGLSASFDSGSGDEELFSGQPDSYGEVLRGGTGGSQPLVLSASAGFEPGEVRIFSAAAITGNTSLIALEPGATNSGYSFGACTRSVPAGVPVDFSLGSGGVDIKVFASADGVSWSEPVQLISDVEATPTSVSNFLLPNGVPSFTGAGALTQVFHFAGSTGYAASAPGVKWLAQHDPRAPVLGRLATDPWALNPLWRTTAEASRVPTAAVWGPDFSLAGGGQSHVSLYHILRANPLSIASLRFADIGAHYSDTIPRPAFAIGNSYASPYISAGSKDFSYALNEALWDRYFFSGLSALVAAGELTEGLAGTDYPNRRLVPTRFGGINASGFGYQDAAAKLMVSGAFNVNSTSVDAWAAVLSGMNRIDLRYWDPVADLNVTETEVHNPYPRSPYGNGGSAHPWRGFRSLSDQQVRDLAVGLVDQVRRRGPFMKLSDFVNRSLTASASSPESQAGALQVALDYARSTTLAGDPLPNPGINPGVLPANSNASPPFGLGFREAAIGNLSTGAPGWLTQADILTAIGPFLAVRSDTFTIRAYGETVNPLIDDPDDPNYVQARAWCEAVVQRVPEYVDPTDAPWERGVDLSEMNAQFGRRFVITSFRWLSPDDI